MPCMATQDTQVIVKISDKIWSTEGGNGKLLQFLPWDPMNVSKGKKIWHWKSKPSRSEGVQYATGEEWRAITNGSKKNEDASVEMKMPKWKWRPVVDVPGAKSKVQCHKEQYCIGTWNVRSMNQGKLDVVKQEMVRWNWYQHLRIQWTKMDWNG